MDQRDSRLPIRFGLKWLLVGVALVGMAIAGVLTANTLWVGTVSMLTVSLLVLAAIAALFGRPVARPFWGGLLIGAGVYFACNVYPAADRSLFPTDDLLQVLHAQVAPFQAAARTEPGFVTQYRSNTTWTYQVGPNSLFVGEHTLGATRRIGHCVLAIAFGFVCGMASARIARWRTAEEPSRTEGAA